MTDMTIGTVTITKILTDDNVYVTTYSETPDGDPLLLIDALGMIEMAKDSLIRQARGEDEDEDE